MASSDEIDAALLDLGRQLKARRKAAGLTQDQLARRTGYKRTTVTAAETGDRRSANFWRRVDDELSAGRTFMKAYSDIEAMGQVRRLPPLRPGDDGGAMRTVTDAGRCPHCRRQIAVKAHVILSVTDNRSPGR